MTIYSKTFGTAGPSIVMLHGWGFHSDIMQPLVENLSMDHKVTVIDLPGFGRSQPFKEKYDLNNICEAILKVSPINATYIGWSLGGLLAMQIALHHATRVNKLITIASNPCFIQKKDWPGVDPSVFAEFEKGVAQDAETTLRRFALLAIQGGLRHSNIYQTVKEQLFSHGVPNLTALLGGLEILKTTDMRAHINTITCPKKFIFAEKDNLVPIAVAENIKQLAPGAEVAVISETSHAAFLFKNIEIVNEIRTIKNSN
jgi:pimeloyl-[acyl-carrier protein] methyl ester esterase